MCVRAVAMLLGLSSCTRLVQPATCRQTGIASADLFAEVSPAEPFTEPDAGTAPAYSLALTPRGTVALPAVILATNVVVTEYHPEALEFLFRPANVASPVEVRFKATCGGTPLPVLQALLAPAEGGYGVTLSDVP